jgi:hypothetical protein
MSTEKAHVMVDIETLGNGNDALILAIGACKFHPRGPGIEPGAFYVKIDPESAVKAGGVMDASTVLWWMAQGDAARKELTNPEGRVGMLKALNDFNRWVGGDVPVWGNGATFDNVIIKSAMKRLGIEPCWKFWSDQCYRTLKTQFKHIKLERSGIAHSAIDDAITQAKHLQAIFRSLPVP